MPFLIVTDIQQSARLEEKLKLMFILLGWCYQPF